MKIERTNTIVVDGFDSKILNEQIKVYVQFNDDKFAFARITEAGDFLAYKLPKKMEKSVIVECLTDGDVWSKFTEKEIELILTGFSSIIVKEG